jgi:phospholipase C
MLQKVLDTLDTKPGLKAETALLITFDEGGGYYDSGFIQPLDFFGDGPRTPLIAVSPYSQGGLSCTAIPTMCRSSNSSSAIGT